MCVHARAITALQSALALLWLVVHRLNWQVGWVSLHLLSLLLLLLPCWCPSLLDLPWHWPLSLHEGRQHPCFTGGTGAAEECCTTPYLSAQWLCRWTVTASPKVTGILTTPSLWYGSQLQQVTMKDPVYSTGEMCATPAHFKTWWFLSYNVGSQIMPLYCGSWGCVVQGVYRVYGCRVWS